MENFDYDFKIEYDEKPNLKNAFTGCVEAFKKADKVNRIFLGFMALMVVSLFVVASI